MQDLGCAREGNTPFIIWANYNPDERAAIGPYLRQRVPILPRRQPLSTTTFFALKVYTQPNMRIRFTLAIAAAIGLAATARGAAAPGRHPDGPSQQCADDAARLILQRTFLD